MNVGRKTVIHGAARYISLAVMFVLVAALSPPVRAGFVVGGATGLTSPADVITFNEAGNLTGQTVGNQFAAYGATFSGGLLWDNTNTASGSTGFAGADLLNFVPPFGIPSPGPFVISFTVPVTDAMFALVDQNSTYQFTAYLGGTGGAIVDSGSAISPTNPGAGFVGFKNELFDTIKFSGGGSALGMDTLQFNPAPEPSSIVLACLAVAGLAVTAVRRRRKR